MTPARLEPASYLSEHSKDKISRWKRYSRGRQKRGNQFQDIGVTFVGVVEARCVNQDDFSPIEGEFICELYFRSTRFQVHPDTKVGAASHIDELN